MQDSPSNLAAFYRCADYGAALAEALDALMEELGGWRAFVQRGTRVLVKPNMLADRTPEQAVTTHPALLEAVVLALRRVGAEVRVGDSPANAVQLHDVWQRTGIGELCKGLGVPLLSFEEGGARTLTADGLPFLVASAALDCDLIVSLPKVKTHNMTTLTAAVKNLYGVLPGYQKTLRHKEYPHPARFGRYLRALIKVLPPILSIADGVVGMEGDGPSNGNPIALGFLAASADPVALDLALCRALRIAARRVPYLSEDLAAGRDEALQLAGTPLAQLQLPRFRLPPISPLRLMPEPLLRLAQPLVWVRPSFNDNCIRCGQCVAACPVKALTLDSTVGGSAEPLRKPRLDGRSCIGCCCCHEVCPAGAIAMRQSPILRLAGAFKGL